MWEEISFKEVRESLATKNKVGTPVQDEVIEEGVLEIDFCWHLDVLILYCISGSFCH